MNDALIKRLHGLILAYDAMRRNHAQRGNHGACAILEAVVYDLTMLIRKENEDEKRTMD